MAAAVGSPVAQRLWNRFVKVASVFGYIPVLTFTSNIDLVTIVQTVVVENKLHPLSLWWWFWVCFYLWTGESLAAAIGKENVFYCHRICSFPTKLTNNQSTTFSIPQFWCGIVMLSTNAARLEVT